MAELKLESPTPASGRRGSGAIFAPVWGVLKRGVFLDIVAGEFSEVLILDVEKNMTSDFRLRPYVKRPFRQALEELFRCLFGWGDFAQVSMLISDVFGRPDGGRRGVLHVFCWFLRHILKTVWFS